jgi:DDE superfamily endonuclease
MRVSVTWAQPPYDHLLVMTYESKAAAAAARIGAVLACRKRVELLGRLARCFARTQTWLQAGKYVSALASELPARNGWCIAEHTGTGRRTGHALIGARQWIPREHVRDPVKSLAMGLPLGLRFRTKGQLAIDVCTDAHADGLEFDFICGDEVYGSCTELRGFLEDRGQAYVLRVASNFMITLARGPR